MLGLYENFPVTVQKIMHLTATASTKTIQKTIVQCLQRLNNEKLNLEEITRLSTFQCTVVFEFGIADGETFNYLDVEEAQKVIEKIRKTPLQIMDFFCAIKYYKEHDGKRSPLKFDYYILRLAFSEDLMEALIFHERGPRHALPEDIVNLIVERVNRFFPKKVLRIV